MSQWVDGQVVAKDRSGNIYDSLRLENYSFDNSFKSKTLNHLKESLFSITNRNWNGITHTLVKFNQLHVPSGNLVYLAVDDYTIYYGTVHRSYTYTD